MGINKTIIKKTPESITLVAVSLIPARLIMAIIMVCNPRPMGKASPAFSHRENLVEIRLMKRKPVTIKMIIPDMSMDYYFFIGFTGSIPC